MARQRSKLSRRSIRLAEGLLLPGLLVSAAHAAGTVPLAAAMPPVLIADAGDTRLAGPRGSDLYLDLTLNGMPRGLVQFGLRDGELWASASALRQLGFVLPAGSSDPVRLGSLPGVSVQFNPSRQTVALNAPLSMLSLPTTTVGVPNAKSPQASASLVCCSTTTCMARRAAAIRQA